MRRSLLAMLAFCGMALISTASASEMRPDIAPFARAALESEQPIISAGHLVLFSPIREVNNEIRSESMARVPVRGIGQLWEIEGDASRQQALAHYRRQLETLDANILFECEGRSCGRSNVWANRIFAQSKLYGRDENQNYLVAVSTDDGNTVWLTVIYTVTRGNQKEYAWVEHLAVEPGTVLPGLGSDGPGFRGPLVVPWQGGVTVRFEWDATDRNRLSEWASGEQARVVLVSHTSLQEGETLGEAMARAEKAADSLTMVLSRSGISEDKQQHIIVGPAVPVSNPARSGNRIELLVFER